jgi:hypothetical protein
VSFVVSLSLSYGRQKAELTTKYTKALRLSG